MTGSRPFYWARDRVICVSVDIKMSTLSETGQFMSSTYYAQVRNHNHKNFYMPHK